MKKITLKTARMNARLTVEEVAKALDITALSIIRYEENTKKTPIYIFQKLCRLYNVSLDDIKYDTQ
ncbi:helix-turn-helix transcriptional regulator [Gemella sp. GH3]|uniref:helix-turn-helix domain-containing protein n=1 Tax=unclassified Gemella TaxID=2624949 RepID=UPI0015D04707|nr:MULTISPECIES: helix-turn-helix transcriptional regulator [unclassified Gemella]MBF0713547.1 helix-turn-helix transcriptional regulator [Gemella sp. GH3.1]NYS50499.1 helix-turn-helix transcriptional regulator [Gemella sp. GH3]